VWLDVSGCARRLGGEEVLAAELGERIGALGHRARIAIADGPRIAQAMARWAQPRQGQPELIQPEGAAAEELRPLPVAALPLSADVTRWLLKLGVLRIEDLSRLERAALAHRLGPGARDLLGLVAGRDDVPLCPYQPPRRIVESTRFEDELSSTEPLLFVLRGLAARALGRLTCRGEACTRASILLSFDRSVIDLRNRGRGAEQALAAEMQLDLELPLALSGEEELLRALHAKLERLELPAPVTALGLILDGLTAQPHHQLDMGRQRGADPNALPTLLAELCAWLGPDRVGTLALRDSHRPEARSVLVPVDPSARREAPTVAADPLSPILLPEPTRILPEPILVGRLSAGSLVSATSHLYLVDRLRLSARIDRVEWWSPSPISRDYARAWLRTNVREASQSSARIVREHAEHAEAWMFVDRTSGRGYLHGWYE
jgi:protein ImuB